MTNEYKSIRKGSGYRVYYHIDGTTWFILGGGEAIDTKFHITDYIHGTIGMKKLGALVKKGEKALSELLSSVGNPSLNELSEIFMKLQYVNKIQIDTTVTKALKFSFHNHINHVESKCNIAFGVSLHSEP